MRDLSTATIIAFTIAVTALTSCGGSSSSTSGDPDSGTSGTSCSGATATCPATPPSYSAQIAPIIQARCAGCHSPGGVGGRDFTTWSGVDAWRSNIEEQVGGCVMPPSGSPQPTDSERTLLLEWLACGAPNN